MLRRDADVSRNAVTALRNQLRLAVQLLQNAHECREAVEREEEVIDAARGAYRHSMRALSILPQLPSADIEEVERSVQEFHLALNALVRKSSAW